MRKVVYLTIMAWTACLLSITCGACKQKEKVQEIPPITVETMVVDSVFGALTRSYVGEVEENLSIALSFPVGGRVERVYVHEGQTVHAGQVIAVVNSSNAQNAYNSAKATLQQAEDAYQRLKKVYDQGSLAEVKWIEMQTTLEKARAMEQIAKKQLDECRLTAPISGVIGTCNAKAGASLLPGEPAVTLLDMGQVAVTFSVPESEISSVKVGKEAYVYVPALDNRLLTGKISDRSMTASHISHSYDVKITFPNRDKSLLPGMVCKVLLDQPSGSGFVVPAKCVQTRPEGLAVWVIEKGKAQRRAVTSEEFAANGVLISSGLNPGDTLITAGMQKLYSGASVEVER